MGEYNGIIDKESAIFGPQKEKEYTLYPYFQYSVLNLTQYKILGKR